MRAPPPSLLHIWHVLILNASRGDAAAVPEGHVVIVGVVIIVEGPVGAEVHLPTSIAFCGCLVGTLAPMRMKPCISLCASTALTLSE